MRCASKYYNIDQNNIQDSKTPPRDFRLTLWFKPLARTHLVLSAAPELVLVPGAALLVYPSVLPFPGSILIRAMADNNGIRISTVGKSINERLRIHVTMKLMDHGRNALFVEMRQERQRRKLLHQGPSAFI